MPAARTTTPTPTQLAYLDFIRKYIELHRRSPAEHEMQSFFGTSPPAVHQMVVTLTKKGFIERDPGKARSIRLVERAFAAVANALEDDDWRPTRPPDHITEPVDPPILPLVEALRADAHILTKGSCWGHGTKPAYVDLAVDGTEGLRAFVARINVVDRRVRPEGLLDVTLNWSEEVVTACAFDLFPNWIMLSWRIEGIGRGRSPSKQLLAKTAMGYRAASKSFTRR
jgi:LexA DNA binding domain-containing protein